MLSQERLDDIIQVGKTLSGSWSGEAIDELVAEVRRLQERLTLRNGIHPDDEAREREALMRERDEARAQLAAISAKAAPPRPKKWHMPKGPSIRDQAAARGEPVPVGKKKVELVAMGYDVDESVADFAVLLPSPDSPTGHIMAIHKDDFDRLYDEARGLRVLEILLWETTEKEELGAERIVTARWLRQHKLGSMNRWVPNWATIRSRTHDENGFMTGVFWDRVPAIAPTIRDWEDERDRRAAAGLPELEPWRCPSRIRGFVSRMKDDFREFSTWYSEIAIATGDVDADAPDPPAGDPPKEP